MPHPTHTALFTTVSGVVGGVGKAISAKPLLLSITLPGLITVIIYAAASAVAGYVVKKILDAVSRKLTQFFNQKSADENE
jgi:Flp pilus assembly pilin Flp